MMPQIDGFDFIAEIRKTDAVIPVLFISALDDLASKQKGFHAGIIWLV